jgi:hypothetical protein
MIARVNVPDKPAATRMSIFGNASRDLTLNLRKLLTLFT